MAFEKFTSSIKKKVNDYKEDQARKKAEREAERARQEAEEQARQEKILSGEIEPVQLTVNLEQNEKAYADFGAKRMAIVDRIIKKTVTKSKKKGVVTRAVVGGVLLGPLGALGGAATAGSKGTSSTTQETVSKVETVDSGTLLLTNKRIMFMGQNIVSLPYNKLLAISFANASGGKKLIVKYEGMLKDEHYVVSGEKAKDTELYYRGITDKLLLQEAKS